MVLGAVTRFPMRRSTAAMSSPRSCAKAALSWGGGKYLEGKIYIQIVPR
jgi:hypothetical protein